MRRLSIAIVLILTSLLPLAAVTAQGPQRLSQLNVSLWPEYDRSAVLVILQAELPVDVSLPAAVELPIPVEAGQPHAVAYQDQGGGLINADFQTRQEGPWTIVSLQSESNTVWLEYYQDLTIAESDRSFTYIWAGSLALDSLTYEVQEPVGSTGMQIQPEPTATRTDGSGLTYQQGAFGALESGQTATIDVEYSKSSSSLTADTVPPPSAGQSEGASQDQGPWAQLTTSTKIGIVIGLVAIAVLVFAGIMLFRGRQPKPRPGRGRRTRTPAAKPGARAGTRFCPQCGKAIRADDRFCRHCGTQLPGV
ncbi:MAG: zinc ribbon domain-containing protein [Anaerolineales bacterium]